MPVIRRYLSCFVRTPTDHPLDSVNLDLLKHTVRLAEQEESQHDQVPDAQSLQRVAEPFSAALESEVRTIGISIAQNLEQTRFFESPAEDSSLVDEDELTGIVEDVVLDIVEPSVLPRPLLPPGPSPAGFESPVGLVRSPIESALLPLPRQHSVAEFPAPPTAVIPDLLTLAAADSEVDLSVNNKEEPGLSAGAMTTELHAVDQLYEKLQELFGSGNSSQLFALEFPGRILDETTYKFAVEDAYADMEKPQPVLEAEFALSEGMLDVAEVVGGPNGSKVSEVYEQALNTLMPAFGRNNARFQQDKKAIRSWLLEKVATQIITISPKTGDVVAQPLILTRMELYVLLNDRYLNEKLRWQEEKNEKRDEFLAKEGWTRQRALDAWANWVSEIAPVLDAKIQARYQDLVTQGLMHEIMTCFSYLDVESSGELLERTKQNMRQSSFSSLDESSVIYPVTFSPVDWAVSLDSSFQPEDLLAQPEALGMKLSGLEADLDDATNALALFELTVKPDLTVLKKQLETARAAADNAQTNLVKQYGSATIAIVQMVMEKRGKGPLDKDTINSELKGSKKPPLSDADFKKLENLQNATIDAQANFTSTQRALAVSMAQEAEGEVVNVDATKTNLQNKIRQLNRQIAFIKAQISASPAVNFAPLIDNYDKAADKADAAKALAEERKKALGVAPTTDEKDLADSIPDYTAAKTDAEKADAKKKLTSLVMGRPESVANLKPSKSEGPVSRFMDVTMNFRSERQKETTLTASSATHESWHVSFFFGSGGGSSDSASSSFSKKVSTEDAKFDIGFRATKVTINRGGWFNPSALKENSDVWSMRDSSTRVTAAGPTTRLARPAANLSEKEYNDALALFNAKKGAYTTELEAAQKAMFPAYPVAFVVAKDMTIKLAMDASQYEEAHTFMENSSTAGGGCFCFSYSKSSSSKSATDSMYSFHDGKNMVIKIPGPQILGWFLEFTGQTPGFEFPEYGAGTTGESVDSLLPRGNNANGQV